MPITLPNSCPAARPSVRSASATARTEHSAPCHTAEYLCDPRNTRAASARDRQPKSEYRNLPVSLGCRLDPVLSENVGGRGDVDIQAFLSIPTLLLPDDGQQRVLPRPTSCPRLASRIARADARYGYFSEMAAQAQSSDLRRLKISCRVSKDRFGERPCCANRSRLPRSRPGH